MRLCRFGAASFASPRELGGLLAEAGETDPCRGYRAEAGKSERTGFTEPKLAEGERRMVDQAGAKSNQLVMWLRRLEEFRDAG
jgi:hypothetical protein